MRSRRVRPGLAVLAGAAVLATGLVGLGPARDDLLALVGEEPGPDLTVPALPAPKAAAPALAALGPGGAGSSGTDTPTGGAATAAAPGPPTAAGLAGVLDPLGGVVALGRTAVAVFDPLDGKQLYGKGEATPVTPASTAKLATAVTVLAARGPDTRLVTKVVSGATAGEIVLVGGGDPTLTARPSAKGKAAGTAPYPAPARLDQLAAATAQALRKAGTTSVQLAYDDTLFTGPGNNPAWEPNYVPQGVAAAVTALTVDEARLGPRSDSGTDRRSRNPSAAAAQAFAGMLEKQGVQVSGKPAPAQAAETAEQLAAVSSPPLSALVEHALTLSDNDLAEALARHVAVGRKLPASFTGAGQAIKDQLADLGVDTTGLALFDGSGLSRKNRMTTRTLGEILAVAARADRPELRATLAGLPVAGFSGTLEDRFDAGSAVAAGTVRAKTGTLGAAGVNALAGVTRDTDGRLLAFAFVADRVPVGGTEPARRALDRMAAAVAGCGCS